MDGRSEAFDNQFGKGSNEVNTSCKKGKKSKYWCAKLPDDLVLTEITDQGPVKKEDIREAERSKRELEEYEDDLDRYEIEGELDPDFVWRNIYQDFLYLIERGDLTPHDLLRKKGRQIPSFAGDYLLEGTGELTTGRTYREIREYVGSGGPLQDFMFASYCFLTRCCASAGSWRSSSTDSKGGMVTQISSSFSVLSGISTGSPLLDDSPDPQEDA
jgi:predicted DNA-binding protein YlxM (UPF0122 family)